MGCRIIISKMVVGKGKIVSVPPDFFGVDQRAEHYFVTVLRLTANDPARVKLIEDNAFSVESVSLLKLETGAPPITTIK